MSDPIKKVPAPSPVERAKSQSNQLRGSIDRVLADETAEAFDKDDIQLLKFHGVYQQDDRDERSRRRAAGQGKAYSFMVRVGPPGGRLTAAQWLALDALAERHGNGTLRLTTRQGVQFHGVEKENLRATIREVQSALMTTFGACGDVPRNILAPPAPFTSPAYRLLRELAEAMARELKPRTTAYHQIWLEDASADIAEPSAEEPFYGSNYLPRKFKIGLALSTDNSVDVFTQDLGFVGLVEQDGETVERFVVVAGGGLGMTHNKLETIARRGTALGVVPASRVLETARAIVAIHRDFGDRSNRRHARLKYLLEDWGTEAFTRRLEERLGTELAATPPDFGAALLQQHHLGEHAQGDGRYFLGLAVLSGRIADRPGANARTALRRCAEVFPHASFTLTPMQGLILGDLASEDLPRLHELLADHGVESRAPRPLRALSMACPALPTCGLALAESERVHDQMLRDLEAVALAERVEDRPIIIRMTGCPNGCARPYNADIGLVGRRPGRYHVYVGGNQRGDSLGELFAADQPLEAVGELLRPLFAAWREGAADGEGFGDFFRRERSLEPRNVVHGSLVPLHREESTA
ncbi:MAG: NADPH-dependent assimilatory sulfite reductase hemoprotein subunit [Acidobacteriota bacterium]